MNEKIQTGLRIPQTRYNELKEIADRSGTSINAVILHLIDMGLSVVSLGTAEVCRSLSHNLLHNDE